MLSILSRCTTYSRQQCRGRAPPSTRPARSGWPRRAEFASLVARGRQMRKLLQMNPAKLVLARGEVISLQVRGRECRVSCVAGRLWVTASGCQEDTVLGRGEEMTFPGGARIVVEALRTATVRLEMRSEAGVKTRPPFPLGQVSDWSESAPRGAARIPV